MLRRVRQSLRQVLLLMARRPDLLCGAIVLGVLLVLAVRFTCSRAKNVVAAARPPVRFFSPDVPVVDLYLGQLDQVERLRSVAEVSLIFFYAPWCAHSMAARQEVQQVAKKLAKQVQFVAVNCWWSQGKCRRLNRFYHYPIIHLFYRRFGPIEYKGPFVASYVESFILRVITPLTYLPSRERVEEFLAHHESRVVGFFEFNSSPQPPGYLVYLSSALQALKRGKKWRHAGASVSQSASVAVKTSCCPPWSQCLCRSGADFRGTVHFGVVTSKQVAEAIHLRDDQTVYLHRRFNSSLIFPRRERNFTSDAICSWVFEHQETVLQWLQPPGIKSRLLEQELTKGPALLLFLPHNPLGSEPSAALQQMADVAVRYHSCNESDESFLFSSLCCQSVLLPNPSRTVCEVCVSSPQPSPATSSLRCSFPPTTQGEAAPTYLRRCCLHRLPAVSIKPAASTGCSHFLSSYSPFSHYSACCRDVPPQRHEPQAQREPDVQSVPLTPPPPSPVVSQQEGDGITGLRCHTNRTLRFYVLDAALNWPLALRLGASDNSSAFGPRGGASGGRTFATIVNLKDEVNYVLHHSPAVTLAESLEAFIRNFSAPYSLLQRHLVGEEDDKESDDGADEQPPAPQRRRLLSELSTSSFLPSVMDQQKDVLLFYYTQWCGFCSVLNHVVIQLARLLQGNSNITVARVNVARNDLPWEFMVDHVPSVLLFPRYRKHQSVKFPDDLPITLPNLLHFLLQHADSLRRTGEASAERPSPAAILRAEFVALQREVQALHHARERLSQQLAQLWRDNRRLTFETRSLEAENAALQRERRSLEEQHREKSRQLGEAVRRLQELADTSESLLNENMLLRVLLRALKDRTEAQAEAERSEAEQKRSHMAS